MGHSYWKIVTPKYISMARCNTLEIFNALREFKVSRPFLIVDPTLKDKNLNIKKIVAEFMFKGWEIFSDFTTNPTTTQVQNAARICSNYRADMVIAIGGGSTIDLAKAVMLVSSNGGIIEDYLTGKQGINNFPKFIAIPTTCGTGSETSPYAVIADCFSKKKRGIENCQFLPDLVIMDPMLLLSLDKLFIASTAIDALSHIMESYVSKKANDITRSSIRGLFVDIVSNMENSAFSKDINALGNMMNVAFLSRLLYPRTGLTITHALSHPLGAYTNIHHGLAVCSFIPASLKHNYKYCKPYLDEILNLMGFVNLEQFLGWFGSFCQKTGIAVELKKIFNNKNLPFKVIAKDALESSNIPSNPWPVSERKLLQVIYDSIFYWDTL
jgi:alcohol dehydrogenase class IV